MAEYTAKLRIIARIHLSSLPELPAQPQNVEQTRTVLAENFGAFRLDQ